MRGKVSTVSEQRGSCVGLGKGDGLGEVCGESLQSIPRENCKDLPGHIALQSQHIFAFNLKS